MPDGRQVLFQAPDERQMNEWIARINYASAFNSIRTLCTRHPSFNHDSIFRRACLLMARYSSMFLYPKSASQGDEKLSDLSVANEGALPPEEKLSNELIPSIDGFA